MSTQWVKDEIGDGLLRVNGQELPPRGQITMSEEKQVRYFTHSFAEKAGICIVDRDRSGERKHDYFDICMCRNEAEAKALLDILNTPQDLITISRECAENAKNYAHDAKVRNQREIDNGQFGGTEGFTYKCRDAASKCHKELSEALAPKGDEQ